MVLIIKWYLLLIVVVNDLFLVIGILVFIFFYVVFIDLVLKNIVIDKFVNIFLVIVYLIMFFYVVFFLLVWIFDCLVVVIMCLFGFLIYFDEDIYI